MHEIYLLRREDIAYFRGDHHVVGNRVGEAYTTEVTFRGLKGDQERRGALRTRGNGVIDKVEADTR